MLGSVKVYVDSHLVKTVDLDDGTAELGLTGRKHGTHKIKAVYGGTASLASSSRRGEPHSPLSGIGGGVSRPAPRPAA